jgi:hypothetical protein
VGSGLTENDLCCLADIEDGKITQANFLREYDAPVYDRLRSLGCIYPGEDAWKTFRVSPALPPHVRTALDCYKGTFEMSGKTRESPRRRRAADLAARRKAERVPAAIQLSIDWHLTRGFINDVVGRWPKGRRMKVVPSSQATPEELRGVARDVLVSDEQVHSVLDSHLRRCNLQDLIERNRRLGLNPFNPPQDLLDILDMNVQCKAEIVSDVLRSPGE